MEAIVQQENYDIVAITETWWDDSHNRAAAMDGYKLFRRDRQGRRGGGVALYVKEDFDYLELNDGDDRVECLWVRIRGKANKADIMLGVCYRLPSQDEEADEIFYKQLGEVSITSSCSHREFQLTRRLLEIKYSREETVQEVPGLCGRYLPDITGEPLVDEGEAVDVVYLDFSKAFDTVSHSILLEKLAAHGLDEHTLCWVKTGWMSAPKELW
ncbi:hypothetical protein GRJ2_000517200 [Grus japonensis]|uniref:Endonuclease/exonuclease/phosphatase domain-containing protein n=1 Tax=Grus japonensis TaxID=30415 RepID=A0ABC9W6V0_GRUJA